MRAMAGNVVIDEGKREVVRVPFIQGPAHKEQVEEESENNENHHVKISFGS
jgi:hypothetical protein